MIRVEDPNWVGAMKVGQLDPERLRRILRKEAGLGVGSIELNDPDTTEDEEERSNGEPGTKPSGITRCMAAATYLSWGRRRQAIADHSFRQYANRRARTEAETREVRSTPRKWPRNLPTMSFSAFVRLPLSVNVSSNLTSLYSRAQYSFSAVPEIVLIKAPKDERVQQMASSKQGRRIMSIGNHRVDHPNQ
ncbi:hypothetical protein MMC28_004020 [Mycoblastus sanguinarius]|nr:hypothetical protein [Mycoblastus sanguinarius]